MRIKEYKNWHYVIPESELENFIASKILEAVIVDGDKAYYSDRGNEKVWNEYLEFFDRLEYWRIK